MATTKKAAGKKKSKAKRVTHWSDEYDTRREFLEKELGKHIVETAKHSKNTNDLIANLRKKVPLLGTPAQSTFREMISQLRMWGWDIPPLSAIMGLKIPVEEKAAGNKRDPVPARTQLELHRHREEIKTLKAEKQQLIKELNDTLTELAFAADLKDLKEAPVRFPTPKKKRKKDRSTITSVALASDWHIGDYVDPRTVNGLNEFNLTVARQRAQNYFQRLVGMLNLYHHEFEIERLLLWLGGDMINGHIHPEMMEMNTLSPLEECEEILNIFQGGIKYILDNAPVRSIHVATSDGNHGRMTEKTRVATRHRHSLEWFTYRRLQDRLNHDERISWQIGRGLLTYVEVYGFNMRFFHGDVIRYRDGVGGITIPLYKKIAKWDQENPADWTIMGHFHSLEFPKRAVINGSLKGYDTFAQQIGAGYEPAYQGFFNIHPKVGRTSMSPIIVE